MTHKTIVETELDKQKVVIFAEKGVDRDEIHNILEYEVDIPVELKKELNPMSFAEKVRDWIPSKYEGDESWRFWLDLYMPWQLQYLLPDRSSYYHQEDLFITDKDKVSEWQEEIDQEFGEDANWEDLANRMRSDPGTKMLWGRNREDLYNIAEEIDYDWGFVSQANAWKQESGPSTDVRVLPFRGQAELESELKELYESGFLTGEEDVDAIIMGHSSLEGMYGGVLPEDLGKALDKYQLDKKFDDVFLGSCGMGSNQLACMEISEAFDGARVYGQGDPDAPPTVDIRGSEYQNWYHNPQWGTGSIDPNKISDPNAPMYQRILTKNAPVRSYKHLGNTSDLTEEERRSLLVNLDDRYP